MIFIININAYLYMQRVLAKYDCETKLVISRANNIMQ